MKNQARSMVVAAALVLLGGCDANIDSGGGGGDGAAGGGGGQGGAGSGGAGGSGAGGSGGSGGGGAGGGGSRDAASDAGKMDAPGADMPAGGACPWGANFPAKPDVGLAAMPHMEGPSADEKAILDRMNLQRKGSPPLVFNNCMADIARSHSNDMVERNYYGHGTLGNTGTFMIFKRVMAAGLPINGSADEDVLTGDFKYWLKSDIAKSVDFWMMDDHKLPILGCEEVGIGVAYKPYMDTKMAFVTADFVCR